MELEVAKSGGGTNVQRTQAEAVWSVTSRHHRLLVTLLLGNACANEALPLFLNELVSPVYAVLLSVTLVLVIGEILPSAICTGPRQVQYDTTPLRSTVLEYEYSYPSSIHPYSRDCHACSTLDAQRCSTVVSTVAAGIGGGSGGEVRAQLSSHTRRRCAPSTRARARLCHVMPRHATSCLKRD